MKTRNRLKTLALILAMGLLMASCANNEVVDACLEGHTYGFWGGLWHGLIAPFDLIAMIFSDNVAVYAPNNNGGFYALGFVLGSGGWGFLGGKA